MSLNSYNGNGHGHEASVSEEFDPHEFDGEESENDEENEVDENQEENAKSDGDNPEYTRAVRTACNILSYCDNTERRLRDKLSNKGYSHGAADFAVEYVKAKGWLDETRMAEAAVHSLTQSRLYGKRRVLLELRKRGFTSEVIDEIDFSELDFAEICARLLDKQHGGDDDKTRAALMRYGHTLGDINRAIREKEENDANEDED